MVRLPMGSANKALLAPYDDGDGEEGTWFYLTLADTN